MTSVMSTSQVPMPMDTPVNSVNNTAPQNAQNAQNARDAQDECSHMCDARQQFFKIPKVLRKNLPEPHVTGYAVGGYDSGYDGIFREISSYKTSELIPTTTRCYCFNFENDDAFRADPNYQEILNEVVDKRKELKARRLETVQKLEQLDMHGFSEKDKTWITTKLVPDMYASIERGETTFFDEDFVETEPPVYSCLLNGQLIDFGPEEVHDEPSDEEEE